MVPPKPRTDGDQLPAMLNEQEISVFGAEIPHLGAFEKAGAAGVPVYGVQDERADWAWNYVRIGRKGNH